MTESIFEKLINSFPGEILEGYGYWEQSDYCRHSWHELRESDEVIGYECIYCQSFVTNLTYLEENEND